MSNNGSILDEKPEPKVTIKNNNYHVSGWEQFIYFKSNDKWCSIDTEEGTPEDPMIHELEKECSMVIFLERFIRKQKLSKLLT